jgi:hypothetical protein
VKTDNPDVFIAGRGWGAVEAEKEKTLRPRQKKERKF